MRRHDMFVFLSLVLLLPALPSCRTRRVQTPPASLTSTEPLQRPAAAEPAPRLPHGLAASLTPLALELARTPFGTGAVICVRQGDALVTAKGGRQSRDGPLVDGETLFNVASVSKTFTAARIVALAQEGRLDLDDTVRTHLPGVHLVSETGDDLSGSITIRELLQHRAGLPHQPWGVLDPAVFDNRWDAPDLLSTITRRWTIPLAHPRGAFHYSNMGYALLGALVERVEGERFASAMETFFVGLGLQHFTMTPGTAGTNLASGRIVEDDRERFNPPNWYGSSYALPFTGAWISADDLARFGRLLARAARDPSSPLAAMASPLSTDRGYGLGILHGRHGSERVLEHDGSGPGFLSCLVVLPERDVAIAAVCNGGGESDPAVRRFRHIVSAIVTAVYG